MESSWTFFIGGKFYNITRDEGEGRVRFDMRVNFILNALNKMHISELHKYSKLYANMTLLGVQPFGDQKDKIKWLLGIEKKKPVSNFESDSVAFEDSKNALLHEIIASADSSKIVMESGATFSPLGETSFIDVPGNNIEELIGQRVQEVELKQSSDDGKTTGVVMEVHVVTDDEELEVVELKSCEDRLCAEPSPILVTNDEVGVSVVVNPITIEVVNENDEGTTENDEVFGDPTNRNAFLIPDMKCYNFNTGDDPEEAMETCVRKKFEKQYDLRMKLRSTKERNLVFKPVEDDPNLHYWVEENRYGRILMKVRESLKPMKKSEVTTIEDLKQTVRQFFDLPIDIETIVVHRKQILSTAHLNDGIIYTPDALMDIFKAYDMEMFDGKIEGLMNSKTLSIVFKWTEEDLPCGLDVQDPNIFTLEPSKKVFSGLPRDSSKHVIFGVTCNTPEFCLLIFMESFIATVLHDTCELAESLEEVAKKIFGHTNTTEVQFASKKDTVPEVPKMSIRDRLLKTQNADPSADIIITIKDIGRVILGSARNGETVLIRAMDGEDNVKITSEQARQPYDNVTHIQDVAI
jgi:hypothetical protein